MALPLTRGRYRGTSTYHSKKKNTTLKHKHKDFTKPVLIIAGIFTALVLGFIIYNNV